MHNLVVINPTVTNVGLGNFDAQNIWFANSLAPSDVRLKEDIVPLERLGNGLGLYRFRYKWSHQQYVGVMAQEVAAHNRDAVVCGSDGYLRVDYARLGLRMMTWEEFVAKKQRH